MDKYTMEEGQHYKIILTQFEKMTKKYMTITNSQKSVIAGMISIYTNYMELSAMEEAWEVDIMSHMSYTSNF